MSLNRNDYDMTISGILVLRSLPIVLPRNCPRAAQSMHGEVFIQAKQPNRDSDALVE